MSGLVVLAKVDAVRQAEAVVRKYLGDRFNEVEGKPWKSASATRGYVTRDERWREDGYPCPYCWISRGTLKSAAIHLLHWHRRRQS